MTTTLTDMNRKDLIAELKKTIPLNTTTERKLNKDELYQLYLAHPLVKSAFTKLLEERNEMAANNRKLSSERNIMRFHYTNLQGKVQNLVPKDTVKDYIHKDEVKEIVQSYDDVINSKQEAFEQLTNTNRELLAVVSFLQDNKRIEIRVKR